MNSHENRPSRGTHEVRTKTAGTVVAALLAGLSAAVASPAAFAQTKEEPSLEKAGAAAGAKVAASATQGDQPPANVVTQSEAGPAPAEDASSKPLSTAVWGRIGNVIQGTDPNKLDDFAQDAEVDVLLSGQIHPVVGWQADFVGIFGNNQADTATILDLIGKLELHPAFNLWLGRMLVPSDRSNFSGPWFMAPWNYPGLYPGLSVPVGPRQGPFGRNDGLTVWGDFGGGMFKYYVGAFDLRVKTETPLYVARINVNFLNPEPGYYHSSTYYGQDILAVGVGAQYKKNGSVAPAPPPGGVMAAPDNYTGFNVDVLYEKNLANSGVVDVEGAYYAFSGNNEVLDNHFFALASFMAPGEIGFGKIQPLIRFQGATPKGGGDMWQVVDGQVGYVISQYAARLALGYQYGKVGALTSNSVFVGLQLQK